MLTQITDNKVTQITDQLTTNKGWPNVCDNVSFLLINYFTYSPMYVKLLTI